MRDRNFPSALTRTTLRAVATMWSAFIVAAGPPAADAQAGVARVLVDQVLEEPVTQTLPIIGRAVAREGGIVAARVAGPVLQVLVHAGDRVALDDVLAVQEDVLRRAELDRHAAEMALQRARLSTATAKLDLAVQTLNRIAALKGTSAFPKANYDDRRQEVVRFRSEVVEARAAVDRAEANRRVAEIALARSTVRASYPGVVLRRHTTPGAYLRAGDPVVTMLNDQDMELEVDVPTDRLAGLMVGSTVQFELEERGPFPTTVRAIVPDENPLTRTRSVRLTPHFSAGQRVALAQNQSVVIKVPMGRPRSVVSVHKDAVITRQGKQIVYVVVHETAEVRPVELGEAVGARFETRAGLKPGELVVVRGNERLRSGQKVTIEPSS